MTLAWVLMGTLVTVGFYSERRDDQARCEAGNDFRRQALPAAFEAYSRFLGQELHADPQRVEDATQRFQRQLDELFPERKCPLLTL